MEPHTHSVGDFVDVAVGAVILGGIAIFGGALAMLHVVREMLWRKEVTV